MIKNPPKVLAKPSTLGGFIGYHKLNLTLSLKFATEVFLSQVKIGSLGEFYNTFF